MTSVSSLLKRNESLDHSLSMDATLIGLVAEDIFDCLALREEQVALAPYYEKYLPTQAAIEELISTAGVIFAPGLLDVLQSDEPPNVEYFKSLPTLQKGEHLWGVYVIVLEKDKCETLVYIGSGTKPDWGIMCRLRDYKNDTNLPKYVAEARRSGYKVVHKGLIARATIPSPDLMPKIRTLLMTMEGAFQVVFWTMYTPGGGDWGLGDLCR